MSPVLARSTFIRPHLNLGYSPDNPCGVSSLPELIEFAAERNPDHIFGVQTRAGEGAASPSEITFSQLLSAVERASAWLVASGVTKGRIRRDQVVPPVGVLLASDVGIFIYMAALLRIGTPVSTVLKSFLRCASHNHKVLLMSARLTPVAIAHLLKSTSTACVLINPQVFRTSKEALELLQSDSDLPVIPNFIEALTYEDILYPDITLQALDIPSKYTDWLREDLDAVIMHSSGTTGLPKPIRHSQAYPLIYATAHRLPEQTDPFRFNVSTLPLYHVGIQSITLLLS
jgi:acyl-CoA synthetase (AMP-forming)/AMP-acid ligase II